MADHGRRDGLPCARVDRRFEHAGRARDLDGADFGCAPSAGSRAPARRAEIGQELVEPRDERSRILELPPLGEHRLLEQQQREPFEPRGIGFARRGGARAHARD